MAGQYNVKSDFSKLTMLEIEQLRKPVESYKILLKL
jgi:hypothetical protein